LKEGSGITRPQFNLALNFDGYPERQLCQADCATRMSSMLLAENADDEVSEAIDNRRLACESWGGVDHSEDPGPAGDA